MYLPCNIDPSVIQIGDTVHVEYHKQNGVTLSTKGTVGYIEESGRLRNIYTYEHGIILTWEPGKPKSVTVTLLRREEVRQETLDFFSIVDGEMRERLS